MLAAGGAHSAAVTTTSGCGWTGVSNSTSWISVTGGSSGTGNGTVAYTVAANTATSSRTGTLTIAGVTLNVTQAGVCNYTVAPTAQSVSAAGGAHSAAVTTTSGCGWTGVSNSTSWISVTGGSSGTGNGTVAYTVAANTATSSRTGTLTIAGVTLNVTQAGVCNYTVAPTSAERVAAGGAHSAAVTTTAGCGWTGVSNSTSWISVTGGSSGTGNGTVAYTVAANTATSSRTGTLTIAGVTLNVTQAGVCNYTVAPTSAERARGGRGALGGGHHDDRLRLDRRQQQHQLDPVTGGSSGTGNGTVAYTVAANTATSARTGTLTIAGVTLNVTQAGVCNYTVAPTRKTCSQRAGRTRRRSPRRPAAAGPASATAPAGSRSRAAAAAPAAAPWPTPSPPIPPRARAPAP